MPLLRWLKKAGFWFFSGALLLFGRAYFKWDISGLENLPSLGPCVLVANHRSYLDILIIAIALEKKRLFYRSCWVIGKTTYRNPFLRILFITAPLIVVNGTVKKAEAALKAGKIVVIFPEGFYAWRKFCYEHGKEKERPVRQIGTSAAILGLKTGYPIIPVGIRGAYEAMPPYSFFPKQGNLSLQAGEPLFFEAPEPEQVTEAMISEKTNLIGKRIDALCESRGA